MTESDIDAIVQASSELKGDSRLVVLLGSPEGIKGVSKKLRGLHGVKKIRKGLFIISEPISSHDETLHSRPYITFTKTREIPSHRRKSDDDSPNRVYTLVSFSFENPTAQQKKRVERLLRKTTGIRLRPGVILFPLLRSRESRQILGSGEERQLLSSIEFSRLIHASGGTTVRWSRLKVTIPSGINLIEKAVEKTQLRDLNALEETIRALRERIKDRSVSISQLKKNYTTLARRFRELKLKWELAKKLWFYDSEKSLKRTYNMLLSVRRAIVAEETHRGV